MVGRRRHGGDWHSRWFEEIVDSFDATLAPETYLIVVDGRSASASRFLPPGEDVTLETDLPDTTRYRAMRLVAAFLKDWDRLRWGSNNRRFADGSLAFFDFGGTLGARARGGAKPGGKSAAIGGFSGRESAKHMVRELCVSWLPATHPWRQATDAGAPFTLEGFRALDAARFSEIVALARYPDPRDGELMRQALLGRRDAMVKSLRPLSEGAERERTGFFFQRWPWRRR